MKQTLFLIIIGITILFISCTKYEDCRISDPFTELRGFELMENICVTRAIILAKTGSKKKRIEGWVLETNYKINYYNCYGVLLVEENCEVIEWKETYCK